MNSCFFLSMKYLVFTVVLIVELKYFVLCRKSINVYKSAVVQLGTTHKSILLQSSII